ncbi:MAG: PQQ-binding-like beta-propeller repeat protein [Acidobacteriota bacterium]|nr:PQQ-binding-like beta-propeller repeat protein [Acidobacteriota bacterium]
MTIALKKSAAFALTAALFALGLSEPADQAFAATVARLVSVGTNAPAVPVLSAGASAASGLLQRDRSLSDPAFSLSLRGRLPVSLIPTPAVSAAPQAAGSVRAAAPALLKALAPQAAVPAEAGAAAPQAAFGAPLARALDGVADPEALAAAVQTGVSRGEIGDVRALGRVFDNAQSGRGAAASDPVDAGYAPRRPFLAAEQARYAANTGGIVLSAVASPDGRFVYTGDVKGTVRKFDALSGRQLFAFQGRDWVRDIVVSPGGERLFVPDGDAVSVLDARTGQRVASIGGHMDIRFLALVPTEGGGNLFVTDGIRVREFDSLTGELRHSYDGQVREYDSSSGRWSFTHDGHTGPITDMIVHRGLRLLLTSDIDGEVRAWDTRRGDLSLKLDGLGEPGVYPTGISKLAFADNGSYQFVYAGNTAGEIYVWSLTYGATPVHFKAHEGVVEDIVLGRRGHLFTAGRDGKAKRFGPGHAVTYDHGAPLNAIALSSDESYLFTAGEDGVVGVWDVWTGERLGSFVGHKGPVSKVSVLPGGELLTVSADGTARRWRVPRLEAKAPGRPEPAIGAAPRIGYIP